MAYKLRSSMGMSTYAAEGGVNKSLLIGFIISVLLIGGAIFLSGDIASFFSFSSILVVVGGTFGATIVHYSIEDLMKTWMKIRSVMVVSNDSVEGRIKYFVELAHLVKKDGMLVVENCARRETDPFCRKALEILVDGQSSMTIKRMLETELKSFSDDSHRAVSVLQTLGSYAPALGLIGTLLGLVQMMKSLSNPAMVGPNMSLSLLTTLYGAVLSNLVFLPLAGKIKNRVDEEILLKRIIIDATLSIKASENTITMEQRLVGYLPGIAA